MKSNGNFKFVNADSISTLEQYGASLITAVLSLRTLEMSQVAAYKAGVLSEDEQELSKTICWELRRLMALYKEQGNNINARAHIDQESVLKALSDMAFKQEEKEEEK